MGFFSEVTGITVASGFKLQAEKPLDPRFVAATLDDAKLIVTEKGGYNGLKVWIEDEKKFYTCTDTSTNTWAADLTSASIPAVPNYEIKKAATADSGYSATYQLYKDSSAVGAKINIPKDYLAKDADLKTCTAADSPVSGYKVGDKYIDFIVNTVNGDGNERHIYINVADLVDTYTAGNGINIADHAIAVKIDTANANGLAVTAAGLKIGLASSKASGAMDKDDKAKLDGIDTSKLVTKSEDGTITLGTGGKIDATGDSIVIDPETGGLHLNGDVYYGNKLLEDTFADISHTHDTMTGASASAAGKAGFVPAPAAGKQGQFLRGDGTWATPANTTYSVATASANGLMSSTDKAKLDGIEVATAEELLAYISA